MATFATREAQTTAASDDLWPTYPVAGHAVLRVDISGVVIGSNQDATLLFSLETNRARVHVADLFGPPLGVPGGVRDLVAGFGVEPDAPAAWSGQLSCFCRSGRPFVVTATALPDLNGPARANSLTIVCGPPSRNATTALADWFPPDQAGRIGHELRGSLGGIAGLAAVLSRRLGRVATEDDLRRLRMIEENARACTGTVDRVVELSRIESGRIRSDKVATDLHHVLTQTVGNVATAPEGRRVHVETSAETVVVHTDPAILEPILLELIDNALSRGAATEVGLRVHARDGRAIIEVTDDGCGIAVEEQTTIFDPFVRGDSADGAGLGLHLARRRAHLIGAGLSVLSRPGHGSTFTVTMPAEAALPDLAAPGPRATGSVE